MSVILLGWLYAGLVALASVAVLGGLFFGSPDAVVGQPRFKSGAGVFLASSALIVGIVTLVRRMLADALSNPDKSSGGIIFSLDQGKVRASRQGQGPPVCLGSQERVSEMTEDFLAQVELGRRLTGRSQ